MLHMDIIVTYIHLHSDDRILTVGCVKNLTQSIFIEKGV